MSLSLTYFWFFHLYYINVGFLMFYCSYHCFLINYSSFAWPIFLDFLYFIYFASERYLFPLFLVLAQQFSFFSYHQRNFTGTSTFNKISYCFCCLIFATFWCFFYCFGSIYFLVCAKLPYLLCSSIHCFLSMLIT